MRYRWTVWIAGEDDDLAVGQAAVSAEVAGEAGVGYSSFHHQEAVESTAIESLLDVDIQD